MDLFCYPGCLIYGFSLSKDEKMASLKPTDLLLNSREGEGWQSVGPPAVYTGEGLFNYIDGGAELYLEFNFNQVCIQEYRNNAGSSLLVEIYEMDSPKNGYGIYSFDTRGEHPAIGQGATYGFGVLKFWKERFFCRILSLDQGEEMKEVILSFGKKIAAKIPFEGAKSKILAYVPRENTVAESIHYFHQRVILNNFYYLSDENILNLNKETEGVFFEYQPLGNAAKVILIKYPRARDALAAFQKFLKLYFQDKDFNHTESAAKKGIIRSVRDGQYTGIRLHLNYLILTLETKDQQSCHDILGRIARRLG